MKRYLSFLLVLLLAVSVLLTGCGGDPKEPVSEESQSSQTEQAELSTLKGEFQGLADGHSVEIVVDGEPQVYQFYEEEIGARLEVMETGTLIQFDVQLDAETELPTIVKVYDEPAQG